MTTSHDLLNHAPPAPTPPGAERRRQPRLLFCRPAWAAPLADPLVRYNVITQDISSLGVGFISIQPFTPMQRLVLAIQFDNGQRRLILCCPRYCRKLDSAFYHIGAEFEAALPDPTGETPIPAEWFAWAGDAATPHPNADSHPVLEPALIPGIFSAPPAAAGPAHV